MAGRNLNGQIAPDYTGLNLQTSSMTLPVPLAWGFSRGAPNLIYYTDFKVHKQTVGKGAALGKSVQYRYSATIILAICEGPITGITRTWINQGALNGFTEPGFVLFTGTTPQAAWSYLVTNHPADAFGYQGICYVAAANYNLGTSEVIPQHSFEVQAPLYNTGFTARGGDADCALVMQDFLTNSQYGAQFPSSLISTATLLSGPNATTTGDSAYQTYCRAMGWGLSPFIQSQETGIDILGRWFQITNSAPVWCGYTLKFIPYGDAQITGHGVTYLPPTGSVFTFTDHDYVQDKDKDPVTVKLADWFDSYNAVALEMRDAAMDYNTVPIDWIDQSQNELIGRRYASTVQAHEICDTAMGFQVVSLIGQRMVYVREEYTFTVGPEWSLLEPMDCGFISDSNLGLTNYPVRIRAMEENDDGSFKITAEEFPGTTGQPFGQTTTGGTRSTNDTQVVPAAVNAPVIFEPNSLAAAFLNGGSTAAIVCCAVSGGSGGVADPNWGGCIVNVSIDNTTFVPIGSIEQPAAMGPLTATLPTYGGAEPDVTNTLAVNLAESAGVLDSATNGTSAAAGATLSIVQDAAGTFELLGPQTATLTSGFAYNLTTLYRGLFGSTIGAHTSTATFAKLDQSLFKYVLPAAYIGKTLYFKFQSFNIFGYQIQDISTCTVYTYVPAGGGFGTGSGGVPSTPTGFTATGGPTQVQLAWAANPAADNVTAYKLFRANGTGASFGSATLLATLGANTLAYTDSNLPPSTGYTYFLEAVNVVGASAPTAGANATTTAASFGGAVRLIVCSENLAAGAFVNIFTNAGVINVRNANATDDSKPADGFVLAAFTSGQIATVYGIGQQNTQLASLTPGTAYYLAVGATGAVTSTVPVAAGNYQQMLGKADTATALTFAPQTTGMGA